MDERPANPPEPEKTVLVWMAKSQPFKPEDMRMRPVLMAILLLVSVVLLISKEWILIMLLAAGAFYYYAVKRTEPMEVEFSITNKGVRAFGRLYMWWEMSAWWWEEKWTTRLLVVQTTAGMMSRIYIPVETVRPEDVEKTMNKYLTMQKPVDTWTDKMAGWVKEKFPLEER
jgi:hypothetical protein